MRVSRKTPDATIDRLSLYHCFLGENIRLGNQGPRVTSVDLARELGISEDAVRRDLSYIGGGKPGSGYDTHALVEALQAFLGIVDNYPVMKVGSAQMLSALAVVFPPDSYGVRPVAYYSEFPEDVGVVVDNIAIRHISEIPLIDPSLGVSVALVASSSEATQQVIDLLASAGIRGVLLLTPAVKLDKPEEMTITQVRMPCDIKSLACRSRTDAC